MIGKFVKGYDLQGQACEGVVLDAPIMPQTIGLQRQGQGIGQKEVQHIPMPLTVYLIRNEKKGTVHLVNPGTIYEVVDSEDQAKALPELHNGF